MCGIISDSSPVSRSRWNAIGSINVRLWTRGPRLLRASRASAPPYECPTRWSGAVAPPVGAAGERDERAEIGPGMEACIHRRRLRPAVAEEIRREHAVAIGQRRDHWRPLSPRCTGAVRENHRRALARALDPECCAIAPDPGSCHGAKITMVGAGRA